MDKQAEGNKNAISLVITCASLSGTCTVLKLWEHTGYGGARHFEARVLSYVDKATADRLSKDLDCTIADTVNHAIKRLVDRLVSAGGAFITCAALRRRCIDIEPDMSILDEEKMIRGLLCPDGIPQR